MLIYEWYSNSYSFDSFYLVVVLLNTKLPMDFKELARHLKYSTAQSTISTDIKSYEMKENFVRYVIYA